MRRITVVSAARSERGLISPVMSELTKRKDVEAKWFLFDYSKDPIATVLIKLENHLTAFKPEIMVIPTDRFEAVHVATHCFNNGYILGHVHAGDLGEYTTDEMNRFAISFLSHILFCNSVESKQNLLKLGFEEFRIFVVGSTAMNGVKIDESLCPEEPYDLVFLHPDTISLEATYRDLKETVKTIRQKDNPNVIWLEPNKDNNHEVIDMFLRQIHYNVELMPYINHLAVYGDLPRPQFLGLLKNCQCMIGNSSSFTLEKPFVNPEAELVKIGERNKHRTPPSKLKGASKRIAKLLATIPIDEKLRRKRLIL